MNIYIALHIYYQEEDNNGDVQYVAAGVSGIRWPDRVPCSHRMVNAFGLKSRVTPVKDCSFFWKESCC